MQIQRYMERGLRVGLGTDFGGGPSPAMLSAIRGAVLADRTIQFTQIEPGRDVHHWPDDKRVEWNVDFKYGFYLATVLSVEAYDSL